MDDQSDELRQELSQIRASLHARRAELERLEEPRWAAMHLVRVVLRPLWHRARPALKAVLGKSPVLTVREDFHPTFRPYVIRRPNRQGPVARELRVLHVIANFRVGGSAQLVVDLIERLGADVEHRVVIRECPAVPAYVGANLSAVSTRQVHRALPRLIREFRPHLVHVHNVADHQHSWSDADYSWYIRVFDVLDKAGCAVVENVNIATEPIRTQSVRALVFVSEYVRQRFERETDQAVVIHPGSDLHHFRPRVSSVGRETIGLVYRLDPDKLNEHSLDVVLHILEKRSNARAIVIGGGPMITAYERAVEQAGVGERVEFAGYVAYEDLPTWYERMNVFVAPVYNESFGQVSVFAMGMGLPVVGYRVGALEEILGDRRYLASPGDVSELADKISTLLDDTELAARVGAANRRRAEERFGIETMIDRYRAVYDGIAAATDAVPRRTLASGRVRSSLGRTRRRLRGWLWHAADRV